MSDPTTLVETAPTHAAGADRDVQGDRPRGLWNDAWDDLRRKPLFLVAAVLITLALLLAAVPALFTSVDPTAADLNRSLDKPIWENWFQFGDEGQFGYDLQGRDVYARTIYGARASLVVGVFAVVGNLVIGGLVGLISGYFGGLLDSLLARFGDIFLGLPFVLGALVILSTFAPVQSDSTPVRITGLVVLVFDHPRLAEFRPHHAGLGALHETAGVRAGGQGVGGHTEPGHLPARAAQLRHPDDRRRNDHARRVHRRGGDALVPRHRPAGAGGLLGHHDQRGEGPGAGHPVGAVRRRRTARTSLRPRSRRESLFP